MVWGHWATAARFVGVAAVFFLGTCATAFLVGGRPMEERGGTFRIPMTLELVCLAAFAWHMWHTPPPILPATPDLAFFQNTAETPFLYLLTLAMGLQNALLRNASGTIVRTTHVTGMITDMGLALGIWLRAFFTEVVSTGGKGKVHAGTLASPSSPSGAPSPSPFPSGSKGFLSFLIGEHRSFFPSLRFLLMRIRIERFILHIALFSSFFVGVMTGGFVLHLHPRWAAGLPLILLTALLIKETLGQHRRPPTVSRTTPSPDKPLPETTVPPRDGSVPQHRS